MSSSDKKSEKPQIEQVRDKISSLDREMLKLLAQRRDLSNEVVKAKEVLKSPLRDKEREEQILANLIRAGSEQGLDSHYVTRIFHEVIDDSIRLQQEYLQKRANAKDHASGMVRVAFRGNEGSNSHLAAKRHFARYGDELVCIGFPSFSSCLKAVEEGHADYVALPIENTTSGGINEVYDLLLHTQLVIVGEEKLLVKHCLVATKEIPLGAVRKLYARPHALSQCSRFISSLTHCDVEYVRNTTSSVQRLRANGQEGLAAIASEEAARLYNLEILKRDIANHEENTTRFLIIGRKPVEVDLR
ncbi:MAG: chorismate mutase, partial [Bdellovibrionales bacterium]|nr:chorismate mutase [Bdellovibrionales bacterium]